jgi:hypothetical protein
VDATGALPDDLLEPTLPVLPAVTTGVRPVPPLPLAGVTVVEPATVQSERARPARLVLIGWRRGGRMRIGNHTDADVILPELYPGATVEEFLVAEAEAGALVLSGASAGLRITVGCTGDARIRLPRRDHAGAVGMELCFELSVSPAGEISLDLELTDPLARGLFTLGLPLRVERPCTLGGHPACARFDGQVVHVSFPDPPPGTPERRMLSPGDKLLVGSAVYRLEVG